MPFNLAVGLDCFEELCLVECCKLTDVGSLCSLGWLEEPTFQKSGRGSARNKADWRPMLELPPVTAAQYCCNFGHIVLGHSGKKVGQCRNLYPPPFGCLFGR